MVDYGAYPYVLGIYAAFNLLLALVLTNFVVY